MFMLFQKQWDKMAELVQNFYIQGQDLEAHAFPKDTMALANTGKQE